MTKVCSKAVRFAVLLVGTTVIFGCDLLWYDIDKVLDKSLMDKKEEQEQAKPTSQPALFYMDADFQPTDKDDGITALAFVDAAVQGPLFISRDNKDEEIVYFTRILESGETGVLSFVFPKGGGRTSFPESMVLKIGDGASEIFKIGPYDQSEESFSIYIPGSSAVFRSHALSKTAFDMYKEDPTLTPSQNIRLRNLLVASLVISSMDDMRPSGVLLRDKLGNTHRIINLMVHGGALILVGAASALFPPVATHIPSIAMTLTGTYMFIDGIIGLMEQEREEAKQPTSPQEPPSPPQGGSVVAGGNSPDTADREPDRGGGSSGGNQSSGGNNSTGSSTDNSNTGSSNTGDNNTNTGGSSGGNSPDPAPAPEPDRGGGSGGSKEPDGGSDKGGNTHQPGGTPQIITEMRSSPRT